VKEKVGIKRQEIVEEIKCFRYWGIGHYKWEYLNIKVERKRKRKEEAVHVARLQKA